MDDMLHNATMYQMIKKGCDNLVIKKIECLNGKERNDYQSMVVSQAIRKTIDHKKIFPRKSLFLDDAIN